MEITTAKIEEMDIVRALFSEYQQWLGIDLCFQNFEKELHELPGCYQEPEGAIFLAKEEGQIVGCIAIRPRAGKEAELKRLYVMPKAQGKGFGKLLLAHALQIAHSMGYESVVLDTLPIMKAAKALYISFGFKKIEPYYNNPLEGVEYYRRDSAQTSSNSAELGKTVCGKVKQWLHFSPAVLFYVLR